MELEKIGTFFLKKRKKAKLKKSFSNASGWCVCSGHGYQSNSVPTK